MLEPEDTDDFINDDALGWDDELDDDIDVESDCSLPHDMLEEGEDPECECVVCNVVIGSKEHEKWKRVAKHFDNAIYFRDTAYTRTGILMNGCVAVILQESAISGRPVLISDLYKYFDTLS